MPQFSLPKKHAAAALSLKGTDGIGNVNLTK